MTACNDRHRLLVRLVDEPAADVLSAEDEAHLAQCAECRAALDEQRLVAGILRSRPALRPSAAFAVRLASRLDEVSGWLGILDWRTWTFRLAPVALALALTALFTGTSSSSASSSAATDATSSTTTNATATLDAWIRGVAEPSSAASAVWQDGTSSDALLETMLSGSSGQREPTNVR
jgi:anti-sigma factor RsiW